MMNDEAFDYKIHRLKPGRSTCMEKGNWAYLDSRGGLHKIKNYGYYHPWGSDMWVHSVWSKNRRGELWFWTNGVECCSTKGEIISLIESRVHQWPLWTEGFGKTEGFEAGV